MTQWQSVSQGFLLNNSKSSKIIIFMSLLTIFNDKFLINKVYKKIPKRFIKTLSKSLIHMVQCPPLNRITLGQHRNDNNNRMIQLTKVSCVLLRYNGTSNIWLQYGADSILRDPIKRRALYMKNFSKSLVHTIHVKSHELSVLIR